MKSLLATLVLLLLVNRVWTGPEEPASSSAQRWAIPWRNVVPDAENARLALIGLGAAPNEDPILFGRQRIDAYEERVQRGPNGVREGKLAALFVDLLPTPARGYDTRFAETGCPVRNVDCAVWAGRFASQLDILEARSEVRLRRYESTLSLPHYEEGFTPSAIDIQPGFGGTTLTLHLDLIARDVAAGAAPAGILDRLLHVADFWRHAGEKGRSAATKWVSWVVIERCWWIADGLANRLDAAELRALQPKFDALFVGASAAHFDLSPEFRSQSLGLDHGFRQFLSRGQVLRECLVAKLSTCLQTAVMSQAFLPQATANLVAATNDALARLQAVPPDDYTKAIDVFDRTIREVHPTLGGDMVHPFVHGNATGRILAATAVPDTQWIERRNDIEVLRRMFVLKLDARRRGLAANAMAGYLAAQSHALKDPYTGAAFAWNASLQELSFVPYSPHWLRPRFTVSMREPWSQGVFDCTSPVHVRFRRRLSDTETRDLTDTVGCSRAGVVDAFFPLHLGEDDPGPVDFWDTYQEVLFASNDAGAHVRLAWREEDGRLRNYEALDLPLAGQYRRMEALGHRDGPLIEVSAEPATNVQLVRLNLRNQPLGDLARGLVRAKRVAIAPLGAECAAQRITAVFGTIELDNLLSLLASFCDPDMKTPSNSEHPGTTPPAEQD